jgi:intraflagellar transport protein 172
MDDAASSEADALRRAARAVQLGDGATGASTLASLPKGPPVDAAHFGVYEEIACLALAFALEDENAFENAENDAFAAVVNTESYLAKLVDSMRATPDVHADALRAFRDLREAARLTRVSFSASNSEKKDVDGLRFVAAKASTSLLRLASRLPADAVFFRAGVSCRAAGDSNSAFVFLNRYLDIADSIDDAADASFDGMSPSPRASSGKTLKNLDNDDFANTDVPKPARLFLPSAHAVDERRREEARDWVLTISMDRAVTQQLPERKCQKCQGSTFAGALTCHRCGAESEACAVTGWPVPAGERVDAGGGRGANRADWNAWANAVGTDPWDPAKTRY